MKKSGSEPGSPFFYERHLGLASFLWKLDENRWETSSEMADLLGLTPDIPRDRSGWLSLIEPSHRELVSSRLEELLAKGLPGNFTVELEYPVRRPCDGSLRWVHCQGQVSGQPSRRLFNGLLIDITEQHHQTEALRRMTRLYNALAQVNQKMVRLKDRDELLLDVCQIMVEVGQFSMVWIAWGGPGLPQLETIASYGDTKDFLKRNHARSDESSAKLGVVSPAIRTGTAQVINDVSHDPRALPWRDELLASGFASVGAFPLWCGHDVAGALVVKSAELDAFASEEIALLTQTAADVSFALDHLTLNQARDAAYEALRLSEEKYALAFRQSPMAILITRITDGQYLEVNESFERILGWTPQETLGRSSLPHDLNIWVYPDDRNRMIHTLKEKGFTAEFEADFRHKDGHTVRCLMSARRIKINGEDCLLSLVRDFTEFRAQEAALKRITRLYQALAEINYSVSQIREPQVLWQKLCQILVEQGGFKLAWIGWDHPDHQLTVGAQFGDTLRYLDGIIVRSDTSPEGQGPTGRALRSGRPEVVNDLLYSSGFSVWRSRAEQSGFHSSATFPIWQEGKTVGGLMVYSTEKNFFGSDEVRLLEEAVRNIVFALDRTELERQNRAAEEQQRLLKEQLQQSQKLEALGSLAGGVAHDLNNVLGAILGAASALQTISIERPQEKHTVDTITQACLRGRSVIKSLLYFARKELQEERLVDLNSVLSELAELLRHTTLQKIRLDLQLAENTPFLMGDGGALSQAFMNLCVNAIDAMPDGGQLSISTRFWGKTLQVKISDTGMGMPAEVLAKATDPFFTTKPQGKGTGLGLSQVFGTMRAHGGSLRLESTVGKGTTVFLDFPAERLSVQRPNDHLPVLDNRIRSLSILIADDDELIREAMLELLSQLGHQATCVAGGQEAVDRFTQGEIFDLLILDMNMPQMSGGTALTLIRQNHPHQKILVTTGYDAEATVNLVAEGIKTLHKPFTAEELKEALAALGPW
ncbi:MAG: GAF domain-containing protein [Spirochaetales bacterium]|nr:GAF domain-containing protein [Spirochaetales bacterium]